MPWVLAALILALAIIYHDDPELHAWLDPKVEGALTWIAHHRPGAESEWMSTQKIKYMGELEAGIRCVPFEGCWWPDGTERLIPEEGESAKAWLDRQGITLADLKRWQCESRERLIAMGYGDHVREMDCENLKSQ